MNFRHPLALATYVLLGVCFLFFVVRQTRQFSDASPSLCINESVAAAKAIRSAPRSSNAALQLAEISRALGLVHSVSLVADNAQVARVTGTDLPKLRQSLQAAAMDVGTTQLGLERDDVRAIWS